MRQVTVKVGYTKSREDPIGTYRDWGRQALVGCDVEVIDGLGNKIEISAREGTQGYRIALNGKTVAEAGT